MYDYLSIRVSEYFLELNGKKVNELNELLGPKIPSKLYTYLGGQPI